MLTILDKYILKRYLTTFVVMLLMFIPIGIIIDVSEKVNKMIENHVPFSAIAKYYVDFTIYFANLLFPIFLFFPLFPLVVPLDVPFPLDKLFFVTFMSL